MIFACLILGALIGVAFVEAVFRLRPSSLWSIARVVLTAAALVGTTVLHPLGPPVALVGFVAAKTYWIVRKGTPDADR